MNMAIYIINAAQYSTIGLVCGYAIWWGLERWADAIHSQTRR